MFLGQPVPACGFSLGLERILVVMGDRGMFPAEAARTGPDVLVTVWEGEAAPGLALARTLRAAGLRVEVYPDPDRIGKQLKYASIRGARFATILGDEERAHGTVAVKELATGEQTVVASADLAGWLLNRQSSMINRQS